MEKNITEVPEQVLTKERNMEHWTPDEKETCKSKYGCEILVENGTFPEVCTKQAPNDAYIIQYLVDEKLCFDLTRGLRTKLFDMYWDKFRHNLKSIDFGYGTMNPKLWGYQAPKTKKRK